jgi:RNA polymerase sigma-70 factor, ECF subfamily
VAEQDSNPFEAAYEAYADRLYRYALLLLADAAGAEDAVQQAFVRIAAGGPAWSDIRTVEAYLRVAVRNECYRMLRQKRSRRQVETEAARLLEPAAEPPPPEDDRLALEQALRDLPAEQREVLHLKMYEQRTFQQIGEQLGIPLNTAASRYRYAIDRLRQTLNSVRRRGTHDDDENAR